MLDTDSPNSWNRIGQIFEQLLHSEDPVKTIAAIEDKACRELITQLWAHHVEAGEEEFLSDSALNGPVPVFVPGQRLCNRFVIEAYVGAGGMGEVYGASDERLGGQVAIKTIARLLSPIASIRRKFLGEVQNARRITHRNVCRIHDVFDDGETVFFTMEFLHGRTLDAVLASNEFDRRAAPGWIREIALGLEAAHAEGVLHVDLKPGNVFIENGANGRAVITDFGLARAIGKDQADRMEGSLSLLGGTSAYMAPELKAGNGPTVASDLFAFGKIASQLLPKERWWEPYLRPDPRQRPADLKEALQSLSSSGTRRAWLGGGVLAAAGIGAAAYRFSDSPKASIPFGSRLVVNGVFASVSLVSTARAVRSLLVTALSQSPRVRTVMDQDLYPALRRIVPEGRLPVDSDVLKQLIASSNADYWVDSTLTEIGGRFGWRLSVRRAVDGLAILERSMQEYTSAIALAEAGARWLRNAAGESEESMRQNPVAAGDYTSNVPEALDRYAEAMEHYAVGEVLLTIPLLEEALRLDPRFAQAQAVLGMCLNNRYRPVEAIDRLELAMRLAERLPVQEKTAIAANYYRLTEDPVRMVEEARKTVALRAYDPRYHRILANVLCSVGSASESIAPIRRAIELAPRNELNWNELVLNLCEANRFAEAIAEYGKARGLGMKSPYLEHGAGVAYLGLGEYGKAENCFLQLPGKQGRLINAAKFLSGAVESAIAGWLQDRAAARSQSNRIDEHDAAESLTGAYFLSDRVALARSELLNRPELPVCPQNARRLQGVAFWANRLGLEEAAVSAVAALREIATRWPNGQTTGLLAYGEALLSIGRREDPSLGQARLLETLGSTFSPIAFSEIARACAMSNRHDLAEEYWRKFDNCRGTMMKLWFPGYLLMGWRDRLTITAGGTRQAPAKDVLRCWSHSQPQLQIVQAAKAILHS